MLAWPSPAARAAFAIMEARLGRAETTTTGDQRAPAGDRRARAEALAAGLMSLRQAVERGTLA